MCARTIRIWLTPISISRSSARTGCDCYSRYLVRMDEMLESLKIIHQAIENLPAGPNVDVDSKAVFPDKSAVYRVDRRPDSAF